MEKLAICYARVSSESQVDGYSLDIQIRECRKAAKKLNTELVMEYVEEGVSGTIFERPALSQAIAYCAKHKNKIAYFLVLDVDRVARDTSIYLMIKSTLNGFGVEIHSINQPNITQTPEGRFFENIYSGVAQLEREKILERTLAGQYEAREQGAWIHHPPYGYENDRSPSNIATLKPNRAQAKAVLKAFEWSAEGKEQQYICDKLNALGYKTKRGGKFTKQTMSYLLRNPAYIGKIRDPDNEDRLIQGLHEAIVPTELWEKVQQRLRGNGAQAKRSKFNPNFPLTNVLRCAECNSKLTAGFSKGKRGTRYGYYHCNKSGCKSKSIPYLDIEKEFERALKSIQPSPLCQELFEKDFIAVYKDKWKAAVDDKIVLSRRIIELEKKRNRIEDAFIENKIDEDTYKRQLSRVTLELLQATEQQEETALSEHRMKEVLLFSRKFLTSIWNTWKNGTAERKRAIQQLIFPMGIRCTPDFKLGTLVLPPLLRLINDSNPDRSNVVDRVGFEPTTNCLRGNCSTN